VLVTGGAGYIGSHTCVELLRAGEDVVLIENFSNSGHGVIEKIKKLGGRDFTVYAADLTDADSIRRIFKKERPESVIHFAGFKAVGESVSKPLEYYYNNVYGTINLLRAMDEFDCKKLVFSSSATVYGDTNPAPYTEAMPLSSTSPYGSTKVVIEGIARELYAADPTFRILILRYFNPAGAHESGLIGESPNGIPNNLMPIVCRVASGAQPKLSVYGGDYPTKDGTCGRDYLHVCDLAKGHTAALSYIRENAGIEAVNLGRGVSCSVLEFIAAFEKANGIKIPYEITARRPGDVALAYSNADKAKKLLGWTADRTLDEMCRDSWNFIKSGDCPL
jgi:UDP-glucose 4-epimerase